MTVPRRASTEHPVTLFRRALDLQVQARVFGQLGMRPGLHFNGMAFTEDAPNFWGIAFPPLEDSHEPRARTLLICSESGKRLIFAPNEIEYRVFDATPRLSFGCATCGRKVVWMPVPNDPYGAASKAALGQQKRRHAHQDESDGLLCIGTDRVAKRTCG